MLTSEQVPTEARTWQTVAKERRLSLRQVGDLIGRPHSTMLAYSCGKRRMPPELLSRLGEILGERVA